MAKTGSIALGFVTVYGDVVEDNIIELFPVASIVFDNPEISLTGYQTNIVDNVGKFSFGATDVLIVGDETLITPGPANFSFSSQVDTIGIVEIIPTVSAKMEFSSPNIVISGFETIVSLSPPAIQLTGAAIDINGYKTIIRPEPAEINFSSSLSAGVSPFTIREINIIDVVPQAISFSGDRDINLFGYKTILSPEPAKISFDGYSNINIVLRDVTSVIATLPMFSAEITASISDTLTTIENTFPRLIFDSYSGGTVNIDLPEFILNINGTISHNGSFLITFPNINLKSFVGSILYEDIPNFTLDINGVVNSIAQITARFQMLSIVGNAYKPNDGNIDINLPNMNIMVKATSGIVGDLVGRLARVSFNSTALYGINGDLEGTFKIIQFNSIGKPFGPGSISAEFKILNLLFLSDSMETDILRYVKERIR